MKINSFRNIYLSGLSYFVPTRKVGNQEIIDANSLRIKADWIASRIGITERRWADEIQAASDLAVAAIQKLPVSDWEGSLYVSTISPDYLTPSTASVIKQKLKRKDYFPGIDLSAACAGQIFALEQAAFRLNSTGEKDAMVVATEIRSRYLDKKDRRTVFLFGDGASAMKLTTDKESAIGSLDWTVTETLASDDYEILVPAGGSKQPLTTEGLSSGDHYIRMNDGGKIVDATNSQLVDSVKTLVAQAGSKVEDYGFFSFHQGNGAIIRSICQALAIPPEKTWINFDKFGNSSSASCGVALAEAYEKNLIKPGSRALMIAMGAGYHFGMASLTIQKGPQR